MKTFDDAARARIARGWTSTSLDQATYAAQNGISTRTLRQWVSRYGAGGRPAARARAIIESAIAELQALRTALGAEDARLSGMTHEPAEERHAAAEEPAGGASATAVASAVCLAGNAEPGKDRDARQPSRSGVAAASHAPVAEARLRHADSEGQPLPPVRVVPHADMLETDKVAAEIVAQASCAVAAPHRRPGGFFAQPENWP